MLKLYKIGHAAHVGNELPCLLLLFFYSLYKYTVAEIPELFICMFYNLCPEVLFVLLDVVKTNLHVFFCRLANLYRK